MKQYRIWMLPYIKLCVLVAVTTIMAVASVMKGDAPNKKALTDVPTAPMEILPAAEMVILEQEMEAESPIPQIIERYDSINISENELHELAAIVYLEAGNQSAKGQQAVAEVVLNRVISPDFPDSVHDVLHQGEDTAMPQFSAICVQQTAEPGQMQYEAVAAALYGPSVLPADVVYFSRNGENDRIWGAIGDHIFCFGYVWE